MSGEITKLPSFVATGETQDATQAGPPPTATRPKTEPTVSGLSETDSLSATHHAHAPALTEVRFKDTKDQPMTPPKQPDPAPTKADPVPQHETTPAVTPDGPSIGELAIQSAQDHINKAMNDMLDASLKSAHENLLKANEQHKKEQPIIKARQARISQENTTKSHQTVEAGLKAADDRRP